MRHPFVDVFVGLLTLVSILLYALTVRADTITYTAVEEPVVEVEEVETEEQRIERLVRETFPEDPDTAIKIAKAESELIPTAYNPENHYDRQRNYICKSSQGVMQIACVHHQSNPDELQNVELNLEIARKLYDERGWRPWGVCHNGKVDCGI